MDDLKEIIELTGDEFGFFDEVIDTLNEMEEDYVFAGFAYATPSVFKSMLNQDIEDGKGDFSVEQQALSDIDDKIKELNSIKEEYSKIITELGVENV